MHPVEKKGFIYAFLAQVPLRNAGFQTKKKKKKKFWSRKSISTRTPSDSYAYKVWKALLCILQVWAFGCLKEALLKTDSAYKTKQNKNKPLTTIFTWKSIWILQNSVELLMGKRLILRDGICLPESPLIFCCIILSSWFYWIQANGQIFKEHKTVYIEK